MSEDCQHDKSFRYAHYEQRKLGRVTVQFCIACAYEQVTQQLRADVEHKSNKVIATAWEKPADG